MQWGDSIGELLQMTCTLQLQTAQIQRGLGSTGPLERSLRTHGAQMSLRVLARASRKHCCIRCLRMFCSHVLLLILA